MEQREEVKVVRIIYTLRSHKSNDWRTHRSNHPLKAPSLPRSVGLGLSLYPMVLCRTVMIQTVAVVKPDVSSTDCLVLYPSSAKAHLENMGVLPLYTSTSPSVKWRQQQETALLALWWGLFIACASRAQNRNDHQLSNNGKVSCVRIVLWNKKQKQSNKKDPKVPFFLIIHWNLENNLEAGRTHEIPEYCLETPSFVMVDLSPILLHAVHRCSSLLYPWCHLAVKLSPHSTEKSEFLKEPS